MALFCWQLGQKHRLLQENETSVLYPHSLQWTRAKPDFINKLTGSTVPKVGSNLSVLLAIGDEVNRVFGLETDAWSLTGKLIQELLQDASTIDRGTAALTQLMEWALANEGMFYPNAEFKKDIPGVWKEDEYVAFFPYKLQEILERFGFNYDAVLRDWCDRGWVKSDANKDIGKYALWGKNVAVWLSCY